jgi:hypothetical protein
MFRFRCVVVGLFAIASWPAAAQQAPAGTLARTAAKAPTAAAGRTGAGARLLPGTKPNVLTTIQGNALSSTNGQLSNTMVRLRDARFGRIVDTQLTDKSGLFAFRAVDPGSYIVEMVSAQNTVIASSQLLTVNAGDAVSAVVKLPFRIPPLAGVFGTTATAPQTAASITAAAASNGVLTTVVDTLAPVSK